MKLKNLLKYKLVVVSILGTITTTIAQNIDLKITNTNGKELSIQDSDQDGVMNALDVDNKTPFGAKVYGNGVAVDTDSDGIIDLYDNCPLQQGTEENEGCPESIDLSSTAGQIRLTDTDGDGVIDLLDKEPNTPRDARVYGNGIAVDTDSDGIPDYKDECPLKYGSINKKGCPLSLDRDHDGVANEFDKEPNTPMEARVYGNGVAIDTDRDGIPDYKDDCPFESGFAENKGCPKTEDVIENNEYDKNKTGKNSYRVKKGDTLYALAKRFKMSISTFKELNHLTSNIIKIDQLLQLE